MVMNWQLDLILEVFSSLYDSMDRVLLLVMLPRKRASSSSRNAQAAAPSVGLGGSHLGHKSPQEVQGNVAGLCSTVPGAAQGHRAQPGAQELPISSTAVLGECRALAQGVESSGGPPWGSPTAPGRRAGNPTILRLWASGRCHRELRGWA